MNCDRCHKPFRTLHLVIGDEEEMHLCTKDMNQYRREEQAQHQTAVLLAQWNSLSGQESKQGVKG